MAFPYNTTFKRPTSFAHAKPRSPSPPSAHVEPLSPARPRPIEPNYNYPPLTHHVEYAVRPEQPLAATPKPRTQSIGQRNGHHRTPSTIDTLAEAALAVSSPYPTHTRKSSDTYAYPQYTHTYGQPSSSAYGASEPPHKRSRSELLPSPQVGQYASRPATSYETNHAYQGGYDSRVEEAALLLNFRTGGWPSNGNAMSPPQIPASAAHRPHANSFPQVAQHARAAGVNTHAALLPPFNPQHVVQYRPTPPSPEQTVDESDPSLKLGYRAADVEDTIMSDAGVSTSVAALPAQSMPQQTQTPPDETGSRAQSIGVASSEASEAPKHRRGWPKGKPRGAGNRKTIAEKVATKRAAARKKTSGATKAARTANSRMASESTAGPEILPRRNSMSDAPSVSEVASAQASRSQSVPVDLPMFIREASPTKLGRRQAKVTSDTVCAGCSTLRESSTAASEMDEWISCNGCKKWFHVDCAGFKKVHEVKDVDKFFCAACEPQHGKTTYVRKSTRAHASVDYAELQKGVLKTSEESVEHHYIQPIKDGTFQFDPEYFPRMRPEMVTRDFLERSGTFIEPICIPAEWNPRPWREKAERAAEPGTSSVDADGADAVMSGLLPDEFEYDTVPDDGQDRLDMVMPENLTVRQVCNLVGPETPLDVIEVKTQNSGAKMNLARWADYYEQPGDDKPIRNVISLEVSQTKLGRILRRPKVVRDIDLQDSVWPQEERDKGKWPKVQYYCLMSVADSYTDFHVDFGGSSVYYHILRGKKTFFFIPPKAKHLKAYEEWNESPQQNYTFLPSITKECYRVDLSEGDTMLIPSGWIHAVWTPETSLVIGGNFLTRMSYKNQFRVVEIEKANHTPMKFRYPFFQRIMWYTAIQYLAEDPLLPEVSEQFHAGKRFDRQIPIWQDFDGELAANDPRIGARNARYYPQSELDGLPDLMNYIWRTVMIVLGRVEGVSEDQKKRVNASIPKGYGEPLEIAKSFALWVSLKRGTDPPAWAQLGFQTTDIIKEEGPPKKLSARALKDLERKQAIAAWRIAPDRQSERVMSKHHAVPVATTPAPANGATSNSQSPAPLATTTPNPSEHHQPAHLPMQYSPPAVAPVTLVMDGIPGQYFSTPKTSVLGPKRVACDTCRKRRIRCKHKDSVTQATPDNVGQLTGLLQFDAFQSHLAPELHDNITVSSAKNGAYSLDGGAQSNGFHASGSPAVNGNGHGGPQPGTNAYISANIPMAMNGVPIFGEAQKRGRTKACFECRRSKRRCVHDDSGNVDPVKAAETPVPRGSTLTKRNSVDEDGSPSQSKKSKQDGDDATPPAQGGLAGILVPQGVQSATPSVRPPSRQQPPQIIHHPPEDEQQQELDPNLFAYPEPESGQYVDSNPYYGGDQMQGQQYDYPSLEQIASEVLDMNGSADEQGDWIDKQLNALPYPRTYPNGRPDSRRANIAQHLQNGGAVKPDGSVDSAVSLPSTESLHQNGVMYDRDQSLDDRLREALAADSIGAPPVRLSIEPHEGGMNGMSALTHATNGFASSPPHDVNSIPLYQPPAPFSLSPEMSKRLPVVNGTALHGGSPKRRRESSADTASKKARSEGDGLVNRVARELSPQETEDERLVRLLQQEDRGLRHQSKS